MARETLLRRMTLSARSAELVAAKKKQKKGVRRFMHMVLVCGTAMLANCSGEFQQDIRGMMGSKVRSFTDVVTAEVPTVSTASLNGTWIAAVSSEVEVTLVAVDTGTGIQLLESNPIAGLDSMGVEDAFEINSSFKIQQNLNDPTLFNMTKCGVPGEASVYRAVRTDNTLVSQLNETAITNPAAAQEGVNLDLPTLSGFIGFETPGQIEQNKKVVFDDISINNILFIGTLNNVNTALFPENQIGAGLQAEIDRFKAVLPNNQNAILNLRFNNKAKMAWLKVLDDTQTALGTANVNGTAFDVDCFHFSKRTTGMDNLTDSAVKLSHLQYNVADATGNTFINIEEKDQPSDAQTGLLVSTTELIQQVPVAARDVGDSPRLGQRLIDVNGNIDGLPFLMNRVDSDLPDFVQAAPLAHVNQRFCLDLLADDNASSSNAGSRDFAALPFLSDLFCENELGASGFSLSDLFANLEAQRQDNTRRVGNSDESVEIVQDILDKIRGRCNNATPVEQVLFSTETATLVMDAFDVELQSHEARFSTVSADGVTTPGTIDITLF